MFLTQDDIFELTGYKKTACQIKWLRQNGYKFDLGGDGKPRILLSYLESRIGASSSIQKRRVEPDFSKYEKTLNGA